jgi:hypothetical protein
VARKKAVKRKAKPKRKAGGSKAAVLAKYYSSGSRPGVSAHQWAAGRVRSFATGKGGARKADADLIRGGKKKTTKKKTVRRRKKK